MLSEQQVQDYWKRGFVHRIPVLDDPAAWFARFEAIETEAVEANGGTWDNRGYRPWDHDSHPFADFIDELARHPALLDAVEAVLGPDILVRNADIFVKNPRVRRGIGWHIDTAERGEDTNGMLTAWLGLTASTKQNGCLAFSAGSHDIEIPGGPKDKYTLTLTREAQSHLDPAATVLNEMAPGMASLHHFRMIHASGPNRSDARRVGFVVRYMRPDVSQATAESGQATLVRGSDRVGNFSLKPRFPMTWTG